MHNYRVLERWKASGLCALRCSKGRYHVARALSVLPPVRACLAGDKPHLGFGILQCTASGAIYRVIFESINELQPGSLTGLPDNGLANSQWTMSLSPQGHGRRPSSATR
jgi:hypothetical protein